MHIEFIRRCLDLARRGQGKTGVNPMVGAVLVRGGSIIAEGFHEAYGKSHAERQLLENFDHKIRSTDVLYVNLEPCCHTSKKTPPCAQLLVERGIKNVVFGMRDPNPEVSGKGIEYLNKNSVQTFGPILEQDCRRLNRGFVSLMTKKRPWITVKEAVTRDGRHAKPDGSFLKITTQQQDAWSHEFLRSRHDGILVGVGTVIADNPRLTIRNVEGAPPLCRIILDPHLRIPLSATVTGGADAARTIVVCGQEVSSDSRETIRVLEGRGVRLLRLPVHEGHFDFTDLFRALTTPSADFHGIASILVEGGSATWSQFRTSGCVDEEVLLMG